MTPMRTAFLSAARSAAALLADPAVAKAWSGPSALTGFTVGGLAEHLGSQVLSLPKLLADPPGDGAVIGVLDHYAKARWVGADLDATVNVAIRRTGEQAAAEGAAALVERVDELVRRLPELLAGAPADCHVSPPAGPWRLRLDDYLLTRLMEITVHSDDLACGLDIPTPELPAEVTEPVLALLSALAVRRHGTTAVLRALSRSERAPATISAF
ncbi:maleylpyruvate isomerase N-terminal domain-containing protein [Catellatospora sp. KI3]|uniref:maleylpyruvate isomerase N-terminal domain-containing protein n=1 Tax=Catellatospora sp. KI3 TaxID=3041620 RepID=UPI0024828E53|nr:maleylpyruvate isomerase N-terminal domain-containing protein [Catellatospora sp. KI3]MDI1466007.1 maleylpyruvate isomerase N-terminal domain-containing protein [Catellatospora sp. KI3]